MISEYSNQIRAGFKKSHRSLHHFHTNKKQTKTKEAYTDLFVSFSGAQNTNSRSNNGTEICNIGNLE